LYGAKAARLPRLSLIANATSVYSDLFVLQDRSNPSLSVGAGIVQPLFVGGVLQAQVDIRSAEQQSASADYGRASARAFGDVEGALSAGFAAGERTLILERAVRDQARTFELAQTRYRVGSIDLRGVMQQQLALYAAQMALLRRQSERLVQRVNLHLALGGGFGPAAGDPQAAPSTPTQSMTSQVR